MQTNHCACVSLQCRGGALLSISLSCITKTLPYVHINLKSIRSLGQTRRWPLQRAQRNLKSMICHYACLYSPRNLRLWPSRQSRTCQKPYASLFGKHIAGKPKRLRPLHHNNQHEHCIILPICFRTLCLGNLQKEGGGTKENCSLGGPRETAIWCLHISPKSKNPISSKPTDKGAAGATLGLPLPTSKSLQYRLWGYWSYIRATFANEQIIGIQALGLLGLLGLPWGYLCQPDPV